MLPTGKLLAAPLESSSYVWEGNAANLSKKHCWFAHTCVLGHTWLAPLYFLYFLSALKGLVRLWPAPHSSERSNNFSYQQLFSTLRPNAHRPIYLLEKLAPPKTSPRIKHKLGRDGFPK